MTRRVQLEQSTLSVKHNLAGRGEETLALPEVNVTDGSWHWARLARDGKRFRLTLDGGGLNRTALSSEGEYRILDVDPAGGISVGGFLQRPGLSHPVLSNFQGTSTTTGSDW